MMNTTTILICSTDSFSDAWKPALDCLYKYWPQCPYLIRTMSNHKLWGSNPLWIGDDQGWVNNLKAALNQIETPLVLTFLEDMMVCSPVNTDRLRDCVAMMIGDDEFAPSRTIGAMRVGQGNEEFDYACYGQLFGIIKRSSAYRISTAPTLWRVSYLKSVLEGAGETAWDFEVKGTEYAKSLPEDVWTIHPGNDSLRPIRTYFTGITRGKWNRGCLEWLKQIGIAEPDTTRGIIENERGPL